MAAGSRTIAAGGIGLQAFVQTQFVLFDLLAPPIVRGLVAGARMVCRTSCQIMGWGLILFLWHDCGGGCEPRRGVESPSEGRSPGRAATPELSFSLATFGPKGQQLIFNSAHIVSRSRWKAIRRTVGPLGRTRKNTSNQFGDVPGLALRWAFGPNDFPLVCAERGPGSDPTSRQVRIMISASINPSLRREQASIGLTLIMALGVEKASATPNDIPQAHHGK